MKRVLLAAVSAACLATPAFAWNNTNTGPGPKQIVDGGPGAQAVSRSSALSASASTAYGGNVTVNVRNGGGRRGSGAGDPVSSAPVSFPASVPSSAGVLAGGAFGGGGTRVVARQAPDVIPPSVGGGGFDCPTVGVSPGGSGLGGGGAIGVSWISSDCNARKLSEMLSSLGYKDVSVQLLKDHFSEVKKAFEEIENPQAANNDDKPGFFGRLFGGPVVQPAQVATVSYAQTAVSLAPKMTPAECRAAMGNPNLTEAGRAYVTAQCHL